MVLAGGQTLHWLARVTRVAGETMRDHFQYFNFNISVALMVLGGVRC